MAVVDLCLDTSGFSSFMRGDKRTVAVLESAESVAVPTIVLGELYAGFAMGTRRSENISRLKAFLGLRRSLVKDYAPSGYSLTNAPAQAESYSK